MNGAMRQQTVDEMVQATSEVPSRPKRTLAHLSRAAGSHRSTQVSIFLQEKQLIRHRTQVQVRCHKSAVPLYQLESSASTGGAEDRFLQERSFQAYECKRVFPGDKRKSIEAGGIIQRICRSTDDSASSAEAKSFWNCSLRLSLRTRPVEV